jgi:hypothetical protein
MMGLPGLASSSSYQQQVDYGGVGAIAHQPAEDVISDLINSSYDLIGLLRDLQRSKRQREDHAQQLIHDLQRSQVCFFSFTLDVLYIIFLISTLITRQMAALNGWQISINTAQPIKKQKKNTFLLYFIFFFFFLVAAGQREGAGRSA